MQARGEHVLKAWGSSQLHPFHADKKNCLMASRQSDCADLSPATGWLPWPTSCRKTEEEEAVAKRSLCAALLSRTRVPLCLLLSPAHGRGFQVEFAANSCFGGFVEVFASIISRGSSKHRANSRPTRARQAAAIQPLPLVFVSSADSEAVTGLPPRPHVSEESSHTHSSRGEVASPQYHGAPKLVGRRLLELCPQQQE
ncbi:hypothetical protein Efla_006127 [Eimeria flavescens]